MPEELKGDSMIELKGKYNEAKIFTDVTDEASIAQVLLLLNQEFVSGNKIRLMPDMSTAVSVSCMMK